MVNFAANIELDLDLIVLMHACLVSLHIDLTTSAWDYQSLVFISNYIIWVIYFQFCRRFVMISLLLLFEDENSFAPRRL